MASGSMGHHIDIEAQNVPSLPPEVGTSKMHGMSISRPQAQGEQGAGRDPPVPANQSTSLDVQQLVSQLEQLLLFIRSRESNIQGTDVQQLEHERGNASRHSTTRGGQSETQAEMQIQVAPDTTADPRDMNDPPPRGGPVIGNSSPEPKEKRMIGDFDGSANPLWTLYGKEAKSYDESRIQTLKDDMDGVLIFAGLFSAALTAFIIDSKENLKPSPADQTVYYMQQNVALLAQISNQISSAVPQVAIPSTPPPPFPTFNPSASDIRVNAFWFMALIFSLTAALLATLVQQWVRDYMHVFQRYGDPLKSARIRQYLHEGSDGWYMPIVAEAVPGLLHVSVFLFFVGLVDFVLKINTTVGLSTTVPIGICSLLYIFTTFAPVLYPQSPYQNSFSSLIWYLVQKLHGRRYMDRTSDGGSKSVSPNMVDGQMQLAMEETEDRMDRDAQAIRWLVDSLTEDAEIELLATTIPGSFNTEWAVMVWDRASGVIEDKNKVAGQNEVATGPSMGVDSPANMPLVRRSPRTGFIRRLFGSITRPIGACTAGGPPSNTVLPLQTRYPPGAFTPSPSGIVPVQGDTVVRKLSMRIAHLLETCKNRSLFSNDELWRRRTRACVETTASLVFCANAELDWFGDIGRLLRDIGKVEKTRESSLTGMDQSFVTRWTCLSIIVTRSLLKTNVSMREALRTSISELDSIAPGHVGHDGKGRTWARLFDGFLSDGWEALFVICATLFDKTNIDFSKERVKEVLQFHEHKMAILQYFYLTAPNIPMFDDWISTPQRSIQLATHELISELPGVEFDGGHPDPFPFSQVVELLNNVSLQFMLPGRNIVGFSSIFPRLQMVLEGRDSEPGEFQELLGDLRSFRLEQAALWGDNLVQLQLWRFQDLYYAGGLGFTVEIFFIALKQLLSTSPSTDSQSALYISAFRSITSDWREHQNSLGTQNILLHLIASRRGIIFTFNYPAYITDELFEFLGNMFNGQTGQHIDDAMALLIAREHDPRFYNGPPGFPARALELLRSLPSASPPS